jgi:hypothetical protein
MTHFFASLSQRIDQIQSNHRALVDRPWLVLPSGRLYVALILLLSMAAAFANFHVRSQQFSYWQSQPDIFFVEDTPLFSTMDAGYFLGIVQSLSRQDTPHDFEARRSFPDGKSLACAKPTGNRCYFALSGARRWQRHSFTCRQPENLI